MAKRKKPSEAEAALILKNEMFAGNMRFIGKRMAEFYEHEEIKKDPIPTLKKIMSDLRKLKKAYETGDTTAIICYTDCGIGEDPEF